jgi:hypothetical protein
MSEVPRAHTYKQACSVIPPVGRAGAVLPHLVKNASCATAGTVDEPAWVLFTSCQDRS